MQVTTPKVAAGDRVNLEPLDPGHHPALLAPSMLVNPSSPARVSKAGLARPVATLLLPSAGDENGVRFPWAAHAIPIRVLHRTKVINGDVT